MRLDVYLAKSGKARSRTHAQQLIDGGFVTVAGVTSVKASYAVDENNPPEILVTGELYPFVGRGGVKLDGALLEFAIDVAGMIAVDVGASTGGFTDCLLRRGAKKVFAVDSGTGQLAVSLRDDPRVVNIERFNARSLSPVTLDALCDIAVADLSFISQTYVLPNIASVLLPDGIYVGLIKPQFECGPAAVDHRGIVKDPRYHREAIRRVLQSAAESGLRFVRLMPSPILGGDGNREFLLYCRRDDRAAVPDDLENILSELVKI